MTFDEFVNRPEIKKAMSSNDPFGELEKIFGNNPMAKNAIRLARSIPNNKQLENIADNMCKEVNLNMGNILQNFIRR